MNRTELQNVEGFEIWNEHGKIKYFEQVDLTGVNLAEEVTITKGQIVMYPNEKDRPALGQKLNHPALVAFYNYLPKEKETEDDCRERLRRLNQKRGCEFISYESGEWEFKVPSM